MRGEQAFLIMHHAGERCQRTSLHFYQHLHHSCHPVRQLMGCCCHTEKGEDADTHNNRLRLCRQRPLQPAHRLLPVTHAKCVNIYLCTLFALEILAKNCVKTEISITCRAQLVPNTCLLLHIYFDTTHSQMLGKVEYGLPAKI